MVKVRSAPLRAGATWIGQAWRSVARNPGMWFVLATAFTMLFVILGQFGVGGVVVGWLMSPVIMGGLLVAARENDDGRPMRLAHLVSGFQDNGILWRLVGLGG